MDKKEPKIQFNISKETDDRLTQFRQLNNIVKNNNTALENNTGLGLWNSTRRSIEYSRNDVTYIIGGNSLAAKTELSRYFFNRDGFYKRLLTHYSTLLKYVGILIPHADGSLAIEDSAMAKRYNNALSYIDHSDLEAMLEYITLRVLIDGSYYGLRVHGARDRITLADLPVQYCRSRFKDENNTNLVEFNLRYFHTLHDTKYADHLISAFPKYVQDEYIQRQREATLGLDYWIVLDPRDAVVFRLSGNANPQFIQTIPSTMDYEDAVQRQAEREIEEIKKVIVQKIPHLADGRLLFEPVEAAEMHNGVVSMIKQNNPNTSVMTTYGDVESLTTKVNADPASTNNVQKMKENIYNTAGASSQVFSASGNVAMENSLRNDLAYMMPLMNDYSSWLTKVINDKFAYESSENLNFRYRILPITWYNEKDYTNNAVNLASYGYSLLIPAISMGINQKDLISLKNLENSLLKLDEELKPLQSSHTVSAENDNLGGRPAKEEDEKKDKTIANETADEKQHNYRRHYES